MFFQHITHFGYDRAGGLEAAAVTAVFDVGLHHIHTRRVRSRTIAIETTSQEQTKSPEGSIYRLAFSCDGAAFPQFESKPWNVSYWWM